MDTKNRVTVSRKVAPKPYAKNPRNVSAFVAGFDGGIDVAHRIAQDMVITSKRALTNSVEMNEGPDTVNNLREVRKTLAFWEGVLGYSQKLVDKKRSGGNAT